MNKRISARIRNFNNDFNNGQGLAQAMKEGSVRHDAFKDNFSEAYRILKGEDKKHWRYSDRMSAMEKILEDTGHLSSRERQYLSSLYEDAKGYMTKPRLEKLAPEVSEFAPKADYQPMQASKASRVKRWLTAAAATLALAATPSTVNSYNVKSSLEQPAAQAKPAAAPKTCEPTKVTISPIEADLGPGTPTFIIKDGQTIDVPYDKELRMKPQTSYNVVNKDCSKQDVTTRVQIQTVPGGKGNYMVMPNSKERVTLVSGLDGFIRLDPESLNGAPKIEDGQTVEVQYEKACHATAKFKLRQGRRPAATVTPTPAATQQPEAPVVTKEGDKTINNYYITNNNTINNFFKRGKRKATPQGEVDVYPAYGQVGIFGALGNRQYFVNFDPTESFKGVVIEPAYRAQQFQLFGDFSWMKSDKDDKSVEGRRLNDTTIQASAGATGRFLKFVAAEVETKFSQERYSKQRREPGMWLLDKQNSVALMYAGGATFGFPNQDDGFASPIFVNVLYGAGIERRTFDMQDDLYNPRTAIFEPMTLNHRNYFKVHGNFTVGSVQYSRSDFKSTTGDLTGNQNEWKIRAYVPLGILKGPDNIAIGFGYDLFNRKQETERRHILEDQRNRWLFGASIKF